MSYIDGFVIAVPTANAYELPHQQLPDQSRQA